MCRPYGEQICTYVKINRGKYLCGKGFHMPILKRFGMPQLSLNFCPVLANIVCPKSGFVPPNVQKYCLRVATLQFFSAALGTPNLLLPSMNYTFINLPWKSMYTCKPGIATSKCKYH